jgi:reactive intermediate/imine deaminase
MLTANNAPLLLLFIINLSAMAQSENKTAPGLPFSKFSIAGDLLFISGQVGTDSSSGKLVTTSFEDETRQVMRNIEAILQQNGITFAQLTNVTIYLRDMENYALTNKVYASYFTNVFPARVCIAVADLPLQANIEIAATAKLSESNAAHNKSIVRQFLEQIRAGKHPDNASSFMAETVLAHQLNSEEETTVKRSPENYAAHVHDFLTIYGNFSFEITELIAEGDKVYADGGKSENTSPLSTTTRPQANR